MSNFSIFSSKLSVSMYSIFFLSKTSCFKYSGIFSSFGDIKTNFIFSYLERAIISECTVLPNFKSPQSPTVKLFNLPFLD